MKKVLLFMLMAVFIISITLTGCGQSAAPSAGQTTAKEEAKPAEQSKAEQPKAEESKKENSASADTKSIVYWNSWGGDSQKWDTWRVGEFLKDNPGYKVETVYVQPDGGIQNGKLLAAIAGGTPPDVVCSSTPIPLYGYAAQGSLENWDKYVDELGFSEKDVFPGFVPLMKYKGHTYLMPQDSNVIMLYMNNKMFRDAGLDPNNAPKTIDELDALAEKLSVVKNGKIERFGFIPWVDSGGDDDPFLWPWLFGAKICDPDNNKILIADDAMANVYRWMGKYAQKYNPTKIKSFVSGFGGLFTPDHPFMTGKLAMTVVGNWFTNALRIYAPKVEYTVAKIPTPPGGRAGATIYHTNVFVIPKGAKNLDTVAKFFKYVTSPKINANNYDVWRSIPVIDKQFDDVSWTKKGDPIYKIERELANSPDSGHPGLVSVSSQLQSELNALRDDVIYNNKDPMPLLQALQTKMQAEMDKIK